MVCATVHAPRRVFTDNNSHATIHDLCTPAQCLDQISHTLIRHENIETHMITLMINAHDLLDSAQCVQLMLSHSLQRHRPHLIGLLSTRASRLLECSNHTFDP
jgi:hypothetical protein